MLCYSYKGDRMNSVIIPGHSITGNPLNEDFPMHTHNDYEIFCFISGNADYTVEGGYYRLSPGDLMLMRKGEAHHIIIKSDAVYERMVVNFDLDNTECFGLRAELLAAFEDRPLGEFNHYRASLFPHNNWMHYIKKILSVEDENHRMLYLLSLLEEISEHSKSLKEESSGDNSAVVSSIIRYINRHITDELSLELLSERFFISKTHLNRIFRNFTGTTVWDYITAKRLFLSRELIKSGIPSTEVFKRCGFQDYSSFFRAYKKRFGVSPKSDKG